jgi:hypothetical protein
MEKVLIVSTGKSKSFHKKGVEIEVTSEMAEILVNKGAAEFADGKPKKATKKEDKPTEE